MQLYRAYCNGGGWLKLTEAGQYVVDADYADATVTRLEILQAAQVYLAIHREITYIPDRACYSGVAPATLMTLAGQMMEAATSTVQVAIAQPSAGTQCSACGKLTVVTSIITGTNPPVKQRQCSACHHIEG